MKRLALTMMGIVFAGCSSGGFEDLPSDLCKKQHIDGTGDDAVAVCDELYDEAPYIHLPKDQSDRVFAGIVGETFVTAGGKEYSGVDTDAEDERHGVMIYELLLDGKNVEDYRPALRIANSAFIAPFFGRTAEGTISRKDGETWSDPPSLPVRVEFGSETATEPLSGSSEVVVTISNLHDDVTGSDGSCLPALSSYGDEATFGAGTEVELRAFRVPSMHDFGDDHFVMLYVVDGAEEGNLMGPSWYKGPIDLARGTLEPTDEYLGMGHGTPGAIPSMTLELADGGGEPCTP